MADDRVLLAGFGKAMVLDRSGTVSLGFGNNGVLAPASYTENARTYDVGRFVLDGQNSGFWSTAIARASTTFPQHVRRFDANGAALGAPIPTEGSAFEVAALREGASADTAGTLYLAVGKLELDEIYQGAHRVTREGVTSAWVYHTTGEHSIGSRGPLASVHAFAHRDGDHYAHGPALTFGDGIGAVFKILANGSADPAFSPVPASADAIVRVGPQNLYVMESNRVYARVRTTGAVQASFTGGGGTVGELTLIDAPPSAAIVDEQDRFYMVQGPMLFRYTAAGVFDGAFSPRRLESVESAPGGRVILGLAPNRVLVSHCTPGGQQTTYGYAR